MAKIKINIDGQEITATAGMNIFEIAQENGIDIPHLCYDERMKPYGACGLCVVEIEGMPKLARSCATVATDGMVIKTNTPRTTVTRKAALSLLVSDHRGDCRPPCVLACPAHTDCQGYVGLIANGQYEEAANLIKEKIPLPASIGRICPHPCEDECRRQLVEDPVSIAALKAFAGDYALKVGSVLPEMKPPTGKKVAVVGAGPAGISCAYFLARDGHSVTIYEAMPAPGGMMRYGIPQYRLPKEILDQEVHQLERMGVEIKYNTRIGRDLSLDYLKDTNDAVFLAVGAWQSTGVGCAGEDLPGVLGGIDFLREVAMNNKVEIGKKVLVVGGGNTAMDVARTAVRLGAEKVSVLYRRTRAEMPAEDIEIKEAEEEGVEFIYLVAPQEIVGDEDKITSMVCQQMCLGEPDASGRCRPEPIPDAFSTFEADTVIAAIGQRVSITDMPGLALSKRGTIEINPNTFETNIPGVFAGGDAATGPKIAVEAIAQGKKAADVISSMLMGEMKPYVEEIVARQEDITEEDFADREKIARAVLEVMPAAERKDNFRAVTFTMTEEVAEKDAARCLECGCRDYFECQLLKYLNEYEIDTTEKPGEKHKRRTEEDHPFIERNVDKCILCGQCIRICDEIMGITALGLVNRGFESIVQPEFELPLKESACISCGQCVSVCPTGALLEKEAVGKQVPVDLDGTDSVCGFCGVGCNLVLESKGDKVYRSLPKMDVEEGLLCSRGRFGLAHINDEARLVNPLTKTDAGFEETNWDDAILYTIKKLQSIRAIYGAGSIGLAMSPRFTNEEAFLAKKIVEKFDDVVPGSFSLTSLSGLADILGYDGSTTGYEELHNADLILSVGLVAENHPIMGIKLKNAAAGKSKLVSINDCKTRLEEWATTSVNPENSIEFFKGLLKALLEMGYIKKEQVAKTTTGFEGLEKYVQSATIDESIKNIAKIYGDAAKAVIVIDEDSVTSGVIKLLAAMAVATGKIGNAQRGLIIVRSKNNSQGLLDQGFTTTAAELINQLEAGTLKAMVIIGEDPVYLDDAYAGLLSKLDFLAVGDMVKTKTADLADVVLPLVSYAETTGTFTRSDGKVQNVQEAIHPLTGYSNFDLLLAMAQRLGYAYQDLEDVQAAMASNTVANKGGFATADGKAHLVVPEDLVAFKERVFSDTIEINFDKFLTENEIKS
ncbi:MAG: FAD-dependent oxidoreductase [Peptococcaceae bacterium]|jgi:formate dehydrogenase major subunit|nr:FAD-dependent oxidoreductase [Peptococcaceae bacterium]